VADVFCAISALKDETDEGAQVRRLRFGMKQSGTKDLFVCFARSVYVIFTRAGAEVLIFVLLLALPGVASAVVKDGRIEDIPGLRFENVVYKWRDISIDIVNMSDYNTMFGGTMVFLDRFGARLASVHFLPKKVDRNSIKRYTGCCVEGTGEIARRAVRVIWNFGAR
jgi:hypothetical protein